jgi:membrane protease YdiL (CAAX protease family)
MFKRIECQNCHTNYDEYAENCPSCGQENGSYPLNKKKFSLTFLNPIKQAFVFLLGWGGLKIISLLISLIVNQIAAGLYSYESEAYYEFLSSNKVSMLLNFLSYATIFVAMLALLWNDIFIVLKKFKKIRPLIYGIGFGFLLVVVNAAYFMILKLCGVSTGDNGNESAISSMMLSYPFTSFLAFCLLGPIVEEFTYRLGLFSFVRRINRYLAYILTALIFGIIHFSFSAFTNPDSSVLINELLNLPSYIFAGLLLCYYYEKEGIACSIYAHVTNNLFSFIITIITANIK